MSFNEEKDEAWIENDFESGFAAFQQTFTEERTSFCLDVVKLGDENRLMIAVVKNTLIDTFGDSQSALEEVSDQVAAYVQADGGTNKIVEDEDEEQMAFFFGTGQNVTISIDKDKNSISFKNSQLDEPHVLTTIDPINSVSDYKIVVGFGQGDKVHLQK